MRAWHKAVVAALVVLTSGAASTPGSAYDFHALKWPRGVVPYYNAALDQAWAVGQAVDAWNTSGAKIRFVAVPRAEAKLLIEEQTNKVYCAEGRASIGYYPRGAFVLIFPARGLTHVIRSDHFERNGSRTARLDRMIRMLRSMTRTRARRAMIARTSLGALFEIVA